VFIGRTCLFFFFFSLLKRKEGSSSLSPLWSRWRRERTVFPCSAGPPFFLLLRPGRLDTLPLFFPFLDGRKHLGRTGRPSPFPPEGGFFLPDAMIDMALFLLRTIRGGCVFPLLPFLFLFFFRGGGKTVYRFFSPSPPGRGRLAGTMIASFPPGGTTRYFLPPPFFPPLSGSTTGPKKETVGRTATSPPPPSLLMRTMTASTFPLFFSGIGGLFVCGAADCSSFVGAGDRGLFLLFSGERKKRRAVRRLPLFFFSPPSPLAGPTYGLLSRASLSFRKRIGEPPSLPLLFSRRLIRGFFESLLVGKLISLFPLFSPPPFFWTRKSQVVLSRVAMDFFSPLPSPGAAGHPSLPPPNSPTTQRSSELFFLFKKRRREPQPSEQRKVSRNGFPSSRTISFFSLFCVESKDIWSASFFFLTRC